MLIEVEELIHRPLTENYLLRPIIHQRLLPPAHPLLDARRQLVNLLLLDILELHKLMQVQRVSLTVRVRFVLYELVGEVSEVGEQLVERVE